MKNKIKKPNILQIIFYGVILTLFESKIVNRMAPKSIGKYKLFAQIKKDQNTVENFKLGIYKYGKKKYFGKIWMGERKTNL